MLKTLLWLYNEHLALFHPDHFVVCNFRSKTVHTHTPQRTARRCVCARERRSRTGGGNVNVCNPKNWNMFSVALFEIHKTQCFEMELYQSSAYWYLL